MNVIKINVNKYAMSGNNEELIVKGVFQCNQTQAYKYKMKDFHTILESNDILFYTEANGNTNDRMIQLMDSLFVKNVFQ